MRRFGLVGRTLAHSFSAAYFAEKFRREGLDDCSYALCELPSVDGVRDLLEREPELCGFNVTIPYKRSILPLLDELSFEAQCIGAVNCVKRTAGGRLCGYNTDVEGIYASLTQLLDGELPDEALVLGTGGRRRPYSMRLRSGEYPTVWCRAMRRGVIIRMIIFRVRWSSVRT